MIELFIIIAGILSKFATPLWAVDMRKEQFRVDMEQASKLMCDHCSVFSKDSD
jgi:hypothetical protein